MPIHHTTVHHLLTLSRYRSVVVQLVEEMFGEDVSLSYWMDVDTRYERTGRCVCLLCYVTLSSTFPLFAIAFRR